MKHDSSLLSCFINLVINENTNGSIRRCEVDVHACVDPNISVIPGYRPHVRVTTVVVVPSLRVDGQRADTHSIRVVVKLYASPAHIVQVRSYEPVP